MSCSFRFCIILAFLTKGIFQIYEEHRAVNLESLGLDTLSNTETIKPCIISKHGLVVEKFNIYCHKLLGGPPFRTGAIGRIRFTLTLNMPDFSECGKAGGENSAPSPLPCNLPI